MTDRNLVAPPGNGKAVVDDTFARRRMHRARKDYLEALHRWASIADPRERQIEADGTARLLRDAAAAALRERS